MQQVAVEAGKALAGARRPSRLPWVWALATVAAMMAGAFMAPAGSLSPAVVLTALLLIGTSIHVAATGYLFTLPDLRAHARTQRGRFVYGPAAVTVVGVLTAVILRPTQLSLALVLFFCWQFVHYQKQNIGLLALSARALGVGSPTQAERRALTLAGWSAVLALVSRPALLQLHVATPLSALYPVALVVFVLAAGCGLVALAARDRAERPTGYVAVSLSSTAFFAPVFLFHSPYAAVAGLTIAHGLQYLVLVGSVAVGEPGRPRWRGAMVFTYVALIGGLALSAMSHLHHGPAFERAAFGIFLGLTMSHFVLDARIWRVRDAFPRAFFGARVPHLLAPALKADSRPELHRQPI